MLFFATLALAQEDPDLESSRVYIPKSTEVDFDKEVRVEGTLYGPSGSQVLLRRAAQFNPLIQLRKDFDVELAESVDFVK